MSDWKGTPDQVERLCSALELTPKRAARYVVYKPPLPAYHHCVYTRSQFAHAILNGYVVDRWLPAEVWPPIHTDRAQAVLAMEAAEAHDVWVTVWTEKPPGRWSARAVLDSGRTFVARGAESFCTAACAALWDAIDYLENEGGKT